MSIIVAILIFSLIVIIHELGHFLLAKKNGICVNEFSLGLGPTLIGFTKGETKYSIKLLPIGGCCMMLGEDEDVTDERAFGNKSVWARMAVVFAGPLFNFILAFVLSVFVIGMVGYDAPVLADVMDGYPAMEAGFQPGDKITKINGEKITVYRDISSFYQYNDDRTVDVEYERDGEKYTTTITSKYDEESGNYYFGFVGSGRQKGNIIDTVKYSVNEVAFWIKTTIKSLGLLISGGVDVNNFSGPVGMVQIIGDAYTESANYGVKTVLVNMFNIAILLSANIGVMNLLPIPALDGGRLLLLIIEAIRKKKMKQNREVLINFIGLAVLMLLMVFLVINDVRKIII